MSLPYSEVIKTDKKYVPNVVILINGVYFAMRAPDSGLAIDMPYAKCVSSVQLQPTSIDPRRVTTNIASVQFTLVDIKGIVTSLILGDARNLSNQPTKIYIGRSGVGMDFADYFEMPITYISKCAFIVAGYTFTASEQTNRLDKVLYNFNAAIGVDILIGTTTFQMSGDITNFPTSGFLKIEDEFVSYTGKDLTNNRLTGIIRGELGSTPATHAAFTNCALAETVTGNPIDILLKILISNGGGGSYDVLQDGLGIDASLIDITGMQSLRDELFNGRTFTLSLYSIDSALTTMENELLMPNGLRFTNSEDSKLTVAILDRAQFVEEDQVFDHDTITQSPEWDFDATQITNSIEVDWDFDEGLNVFKQSQTYNDDASIALYGPQNPLQFQFKGVKAALGGQAMVDDFAIRLLARLSTPLPTITINTQMDKSLQNLADKTYLVSDQVPAADGTLNFASDLEVISRSINYSTGQVQFVLAFTSFTNFRSGYIAPSDVITSSVDQRTVNVALGRSALYTVGWLMRLWDEVAQAYTDDPPNPIIGFSLGDVGLFDQDGNILTDQDGNPLIQEQDSDEDTIIFQNEWTTPMVAGAYRIRFAGYNHVGDSQKRYCFISNEGNNFDDGKPTYKVTY